MEIVGQIAKSFFDVLSEMLSAVFGALPKIFSFSLWILSGIFILPCVFISGSIYPKWEKWGEGF